MGVAVAGRGGTIVVRDEISAWLREAEAAEQNAARCYNVVEYGEHLEAARRWRARAAALQRSVAASEPSVAAEAPDAARPRR